MVEVRGTVHWLTHRDGPARALAVDPDARARLPVVLGPSGGAAWISDASGQDSLVVTVPAPPSPDQPASPDESVSQEGAGPRLVTLADGQLGQRGGAVRGAGRDGGRGGGQ